MARKPKPGTPPASARPPEFKVNPFAELRVKAASPPPAPAPAKPRVAADRPTPVLDLADQALLEAFKDGGSIEFRQRQDGVRLRTVKRSGGRQVTQVHGLPELSMLEQMQLTGDLRTRFGLAARFAERVLEVDGDQRQRLPAWLAERGYRLAPAE